MQVHCDGFSVAKHLSRRIFPMTRQPQLAILLLSLIFLGGCTVNFSESREENFEILPDVPEAGQEYKVLTRYLRESDPAPLIFGQKPKDPDFPRLGGSHRSWRGSGWRYSPHYRHRNFNREVCSIPRAYPAWVLCMKEADISISRKWVYCRLSRDQPGVKYPKMFGYLKKLDCSTRY